MIAIVASPVTIKATRRQPTMHDQFHMVLSIIAEASSTAQAYTAAAGGGGGGQPAGLRRCCCRVNCYTIL